jgi:hypothetical protein
MNGHRRIFSTTNRPRTRTPTIADTMTKTPSGYSKNRGWRWRHLGKRGQTQPKHKTVAVIANQRRLGTVMRGV